MFLVNTMQRLIFVLKLLKLLRGLLLSNLYNFVGRLLYRSLLCAVTIVLGSSLWTAMSYGMPEKCTAYSSPQWGELHKGASPKHRAIREFGLRKNLFRQYRVDGIFERGKINTLAPLGSWGVSTVGGW